MEQPHGQEGNQCMVWVENRMHLVLNNHLYIESTLQPSYTAAMFFLFQDAVVKDLLHLDDGAQALNFDGNIEKMILRLSIPQQNMVLTLVGCALLLLGAFVVALNAMLPHTGAQVDPLEVITTPHVVAQVLLDRTKYPSIAVQCTLRQQGKDHVIDEDVFINSLAFGFAQGEDKLHAGFVSEDAQPANSYGIQYRDHYQ